MKWLLVVVLLASLAHPATAEINMAESIEWAAADSDLVVRGHVTRVGKRTGRHGRVWHEITVRVGEVVRGPKVSIASFVVPHLGKQAETWRDERSDLLVFLVDSKRRTSDDADYALAALALRDGDRAVIDLSAKPEAFTAAFDVIEKPDAIVAAARRAAKLGATKHHRVDVPGDTPAFERLFAGSAVWMFVPVDAALEQRAVAWLASQDTWQREEGVAALAHFRSVANIMRLVKLLADPDQATVTESGKPTVKRYLVRAKAHEVLTAWNVEHATPVIDEPIRSK